MDIRDIPFDVIDISSFESLGAPLRLADGSLDWTGRVPPGLPASDDGTELPPWVLEARDQRIDRFTLSLDLNLHETRVAAASLDRLSALLARLDALDAMIRQAVVSGFETLPLLKDYLLPGLFDGLEAPYLATLFPGCASAEAVSPDAFFDSLTFCRLGYFDRAEDGAGVGQDFVIADYRFLVPELIASDAARRDDFVMFGDLHDITNQVVTAKARLDGSVIDISVES